MHWIWVLIVGAIIGLLAGVITGRGGVQWAFLLIS